MLTVKKCDEKREVVVPGSKEETLHYAVNHFIDAYKESIADHGLFYVALSGGSTPKALFERLCSQHKDDIDWSKVELFWSDERSVGPEDPDSNYHMAMTSGLEKMSIPPSQVHRMKGEGDIEHHAKEYENLIIKVLKGRPFDYMMLGMGDDGHTASLFPHTDGLKVDDRLAIANFVPQKNTWRMSLTYPCINASRHIVVYVLGSGKKEVLKRVLNSPDQFENYPILKVGTASHKALWIADSDAASLL